MTKPIQIRNDEIVRDIRELADLTGRPITEAVGALVRSELSRLKRRAETAPERSRRVDAIIARVRALPRTGRMLTDDDLYDEDGLPR
jgi:hypothetical protein